MFHLPILALKLYENPLVSVFCAGEKVLEVLLEGGNILKPSSFLSYYDV